MLQVARERNKQDIVTFLEEIARCRNEGKVERQETEREIGCGQELVDVMKGLCQHEGGVRIWFSERMESVFTVSPSLASSPSNSSPVWFILMKICVLALLYDSSFRLTWSVRFIN